MATMDGSSERRRGCTEWLILACVACGSGGSGADAGTGTGTATGTTASADGTASSSGSQGTTGSGSGNPDDTASETSGGPVDLDPGRYRIAFRQGIPPDDDIQWIDVDSDTVSPVRSLLPDGRQAVQALRSEDGRWLAVVEATGPQTRAGWVVEPALLDDTGAGTWQISPELPGDQERFALAPFFADGSGLVYTGTTGDQMVAKARPLGDGGPGNAISIGPALTGTLLYTRWLAPGPLDPSGLVLIRFVQAIEPEQLFSVPASTRTGQWTPLAAFSAADDNEAIIEAYVSPSHQTVYAKTISESRWWVADASMGSGTFAEIPLPPEPVGGQRTCTMASTRTRLVCADRFAEATATPLFALELDETAISPPVFVTLPTFEGDAEIQTLELLSDGSRAIAMARVDDAVATSALLVDFDAPAGPSVVQLSGPGVDGRFVTWVAPSPDESMVYLSADVGGSILGRVDLTVEPPPPVEVVAQLDPMLSIDSVFALSADGTTAFFAATIDPLQPLLRAMQRCDLTDPAAPEVTMGEPTEDAVFDLVAAPNGRAVLYSTLADGGARPLWLSEYLGSTTTHHQLSDAGAYVEQARFLIAEEP